jgi:hypothetical protein
MFEKVSQLAEQAATNVSRRQFLGRFGRGAMAAAAAAGGLLALPAIATAARRGERCSPTNSTFLCTNNVVGGACGSNGKCTVIKGTTDHCYCRDHNPPRRGG